MAKAARNIDEAPVSAVEPVTETITYRPGEGDPSSVKWAGHVFHANMPKEITGHADGSSQDKLNLHVIERARDNKLFSIGNARPRRDAAIVPRTPEEYRAYVAGWLKDPNIEHADQLIARFARDRDLQQACEIGSDDFAYISELLMPRLHELGKADELSEQQLAKLWINHGYNQLPW